MRPRNPRKFAFVRTRGTTSIFCRNSCTASFLSSRKSRAKRFANTRRGGSSGMEESRWLPLYAARTESFIASRSRNRRCTAVARPSLRRDVRTTNHVTSLLDASAALLYVGTVIASCPTCDGASSWFSSGIASPLKRHE